MWYMATSPQSWQWTCGQRLVRFSSASAQHRNLWIKDGNRWPIRGVNSSRTSPIAAGRCCCACGSASLAELRCFSAKFFLKNLDMYYIIIIHIYTYIRILFCSGSFLFIVFFFCFHVFSLSLSIHVFFLLADRGLRSCEVLPWGQQHYIHVPGALLFAHEKWHQIAV